MKRLKKWWPFALMVLIWGILFWPFLIQGRLPLPADIITGLYFPWLDYKWGYLVGVPVKNPLISDIPSLLYPWRQFVIDQLSRGRLPFWNPYYFAGMPLLANFQSAVFSYVNLFFLFFPKPLAWSLGVALSPILTMAFMFLFLRRKLSSVAALLGSIVFALCGFEIAWLQYNVHGHTALFLPLLLSAIEKVLGEKKRIWLAFLAVFIASQIFTGYLPLVIYSYLICFFYVFYFYFWPQLRGGRLNWRDYFSLLGAVVLGWLLAFGQIFPGLQLAQNSIRAIDPLVSASNASYLPLKNLVTALAPDFFGHPATGNFFGQAFYDNFYFFVGTGTLLLVFFSLFFLRRREIAFWWLILLFSVLLIFKNPLGLFLEKALFLSGGVAARALFMTDFALAILAAWGMEMFLKNSRKLPVFLTVTWLALLMGGAIYFSFQLPGSVQRLIAQRNLILPLLVVVPSALLMLARLLPFFRQNSKRRYCLAVFLIFLTTGQLLYSARKYLPFSPPHLLFPSTPVIDFLLREKAKSVEPFRVELGEVIPQNFLMPYGIETVSGYDALLPRRMGEFLSFLESGRMEEKISRVQLIRNYHSSLFPLLNVKFVLAKKVNEKGIFSPDGKPPAIFQTDDFHLVFEDKTVQVYENLNFLPRAFWVYQRKVIKDLKSLDESTFAGRDLAKEVVLEEEIELPPPEKSPTAKVAWQEYRPGRLVLAVESDQPGLIFIANNYYPGWEAKVDGQRTKIYRANYTFQAVMVDKGQHQLVMEFSPFFCLKN